MLIEFLSRDLSYETVKTYKSVLVRFLKHLGELGKDINNLDEKTLINYAGQYKPATYNKIITVVNRYHKFVTGKDLEIELLKYKNFQKQRLISIDEVRTLLEFAVNDREKLIIKTLFQTGIRVSELCRIRKQDIIKEKGKYYLNYISKGFKQNKKEISERLALELLGFESGKVTLFGLARTRLHEIILKLGYDVLGKKLTPHYLRHGYATELFKKGAPMDVIREKLGHVHIATTLRYVHGVDDTLDWDIEL